MEETKCRLSQYYDIADNCYNMVECYYDGWFCYVVDYNNVGNGHYNLEEIYDNIKTDVPNHQIPCAPGYSDEMWIVDYAYYLDFHPSKR